MEFLVFKTDIETKEEVNSLQSKLKNFPMIRDWSVDFQDIDHVLRVKASSNFREVDVIHLIEKFGFHCEVLPD